MSGDAAMPQPDHTQQKARVLALVFEGRWSQHEIAAQVKVSRSSVQRWASDPTFQADLAALRADFAASLRETVYVGKAQRIIGLSQMAEAARREFEVRPLLIETRPTRDGEIKNEAFNKDAHAAFREALADIAAELGQRKNVTELTGAVNVNERITFYMPQPELPPLDNLDDLALPQSEPEPLDE